jgi:hypothetical protein
MKNVKQRILSCNNENELRILCSTLLRQGISNKQLLNYFEELRMYNSDIGIEDEWLNVMDALDGWCSNHYKLK